MTSVPSSATGVAEQQAMPSADTIQQLQEAFCFVRHEREDVRKMAIRGIAEHSKENRDLWFLLASPQYGHSCIDSLLQYLHAGGKHVLGDILTILVNCSADGSCAEMLVQRKVVRKAMRLLDGMERSDQPEPYVRSVQELTLMLLNNLTSSHVTAIDDFLQKDDEDMRGFYLGKLQVYYELFVRSTEAEAAQAGENLAKPKPSSSHRDLSRWILHILLNLTRTLDGQELLLEDEGWRGTLSSSLSSPNPRHRYLAAQCYRNCGCSPKPLYGLILNSDALVTAVDRLNCKEPIEDIQRSLAEFIASVLESEDGMARLESVNAKKVLARALDVSQAAHAAKAAATAASCVEVVEEDGVPVAATPTVTLAPSVIEFLQQSVMPYLEDIMDAYIAPGSEELD
ncbi:conserved hypothetical protein [Leishmania major strain Friedlin]|uniref:Uncharacterized protein n=1 Tax=Leishmania major TaxID=5664 RepID=Q4Q3Y2_LEIMA|nr:conserved hypothetical protein [Leishmania major strain Friedlin]CAG9580792.1 hypothetical_protein_-_conserved [Leishmania major strain Friedlin]CAJ06541.1 conserved hypothetical protein [Leishmania major strain Friedlin]|eukprot:XP_001685966.1 conserved hypothetical protein [Leishmania major strain Friedlin]